MTAVSSLAVDPARPTGRRRVLTGVFASATGVALAPYLAASDAAGPERAWFHETYRGRRIVGIADDAGPRGENELSGVWHVTVDGRPLHLMRRVDGSWMTMVDHYQSYPSPLAAARAAVDELGPNVRLGASGGTGSRRDDSEAPDSGEGTERGHRHGVHA